MLSTDSESAVLISVFVNPISATLRPTDKIFEVSMKSRTGGGYERLAEAGFAATGLLRLG